MTFLKAIFSWLGRFFAGRLVFVLRLGVGVFMMGMGVWFVLAPIVQQFAIKDEALRDYPFLLLIVPVGLVQISIGVGLLRPLFVRKSSGS